MTGVMRVDDDDLARASNRVFIFFLLLDENGLFKWEKQEETLNIQRRLINFRWENGIRIENHITHTCIIMERH